MFCGYTLALSSQPSVLVRNISLNEVEKVEVKSDVGENYDLGKIKIGESKVVKISGRDKALWISVTLVSGVKIESKEVYVSGQGMIFFAITSEEITLDYKL